MSTLLLQYRDTDVKIYVLIYFKIISLTLLSKRNEKLITYFYYFTNLSIYNNFLSPHCPET